MNAQKKKKTDINENVFYLHVERMNVHDHNT